MAEEIKEALPSPTLESLTMIEKADAAAKRMEEANKKTEELLVRQEAIAARMMLSGRADAGMVVQKKEETAQEYAKRVSGIK